MTQPSAPWYDASQRERLAESQVAVTAPAGITDGQLVGWSATANAYVAYNPTGASELAAAVNTSGAAIPVVAQAYGGSATTPLTGMSITVPPSNGRPVTVEWDGLFIQSAAGSGDLWIQMFQDSTNVAGSIHRLPVENGVTLGGSNEYESFHGAYRLGVVAAPTTYTLQAFIYIAAGTPAGSIFPLPNVPLMLRALAG